MTQVEKSSVLSVPCLPGEEIEDRRAREKEQMDAIKLDLKIGMNRRRTLGPRGVGGKRRVIRYGE